MQKTKQHMCHTTTVYHTTKHTNNLKIQNKEHTKSMTHVNKNIKNS